MKKFTITTLIILASFGLAVSGCVKKPVTQPVNQNQNANQNINANTNTATSTVEIDTSNWKIYRNEEYGFEFKYPEGWIQEDGWVIDSKTVFIGGVKIPIKEHFDTGVWVLDLKIDNDLGCDEYFYNRPACINVVRNDDYSKGITFEHKNHILKINMYYGENDDKALEYIFDSVISTFNLF